MARFAKGDRVALTGGRHRGLIGRIVGTPCITTSRNQVEVAGRSRPVRATDKQVARLAAPKQSFWAWLRSPKW